MKYINKFNIPLSIAVWLAHDDYQYSEDTKVISATSIIKPIKAIVLGSRVTSTGEVDISELVSSSMGTAIHTSIEYAWTSDKLKGTLEALGYPRSFIDKVMLNPDPEELVEGSIAIYMEQRRNKEINGWTISGQFDFIADGKLEDFKSTGVFNWINQSNKDKYILQASIYRWLFPELITSDVFSINYIFTDWSAANARKDNKYPQNRIIQQDYILMSLQDTERYLSNRLKTIDSYMDKTQDLIPACTDEELWARSSVYKYYKNPSNKTRSTKNFDSYWEAHQLLTQDGSVGQIVEVKGEVVHCRYCNAKGLCNQAKQYIQEGRLVI